MITLKGVRLLAVILVLVTATCSSAWAQKAYEIAAPVRDTILAVRGYYDFPVLVTNTSSSPITLYVYRLRNELPSQDWTSYICSRDLCFPPERDYADPVIAAPNERVDYHFSVVCGSSAGEVGRFSLGVSDGASTDTLNFSVTVASSNASVDRPVLSRVQFPAWPSPTRDLVTIPLPSSAKSHLTVYTNSGNVVLSEATAGTDYLIVDVSGLASGSYFYRIVSAENDVAGAFVVAR